MKKNLLILLMCISTAALLSGCRDKCQGKPSSVNDSALKISLLDKNTETNLYPIKEPLVDYNAENLKIYDVDMKLISVGVMELDGNYHFTFTGFYDSIIDKIAFEQEVCKTYYVKLNEQDTDTLKVCFRAAKTECSSNFSSIKIFYNEELNFEGVDNNIFNVILKK